MQKSLKYFREQRLDQQHKAAIRFESYYSGAIRNPSASLTAIICNVGREDEFSGLILQHLSPVGHSLRSKQGLHARSEAAWQYLVVDLKVRRCWR